MAAYGEIPMAAVI